MRRHLCIPVVLLCAAAAPAEPGFVLRAGEWETTVEIAGMANPHPMVHHICHPNDRTLNATTMNAMMLHRKGITCTNSSFSATGDVLSYSFECAMGTLRMQMHGSVTRDGPDAFTTRMASHTEGGQMAMPDMSMTNAAHRTGPCQPGDTPESDLSGPS
jgi:hypothetical protein